MGARRGTFKGSHGVGRAGLGLRAQGLGQRVGQQERPGAGWELKTQSPCRRCA